MGLGAWAPGFSLYHGDGRGAELGGLGLGDISPFSPLTQVLGKLITPLWRA